MKHRPQKSSDAEKARIKSQGGGVISPAQSQASEKAANPFATFTEWSSDADEKAYAEL